MMGFLPAVGAAFASVAVSKLFGGGSKPAAPAPTIVAPTTPTRNEALERARQADMLRRRRGSGANDLTGGGAEAMTAGAKTLLGQ